MKHYILLIYIFTAFTYSVAAQSSSVKYYKTQFSDKEVVKEKAQFSKTITQNIDGSITTDIRDLKKDEIIKSQTYKGEEPFGLWKFSYNKGYKELNYNFNIEPTNSNSQDSISRIGIKDYFANNDSLGYKAPIISSGEVTLYKYVAKNMFYPEKAKEEAISGKVFLAFTITQTGEIIDIVVLKGVNILLDKEAVRLFRELKFSSPATLNGIAQRIRLNPIWVSAWALEKAVGPAKEFTYALQMSNKHLALLVAFR